jgi:hypothetical protein
MVGKTVPTGGGVATGKLHDELIKTRAKAQIVSPRDKTFIS